MTDNLGAIDAYQWKDGEWSPAILYVTQLTGPASLGADRRALQLTNPDGAVAVLDRGAAGQLQRQLADWIASTTPTPGLIERVWPAPRIPGRSGHRRTR